MMNQCGFQKNVFSVCEEMRGSPMDRRDSLVCPKPRRLDLLNGTFKDHPSRSLKWQLSSHLVDPCDSKAGSDLIDIILTKGSHGVEPSLYSPQVDSSPPFFSGSPPSRVANPLIQDARFRDEEITLSPIPPSSSGLSLSPSTSSRKGGCLRSNFGNNPAVRIEGFDCYDRDRRNCSIPALA